MKKFFKWLGIVLLSLMLLGFVIGLFQKGNSAPAVSSAPSSTIDTAASANTTTTDTAAASNWSYGVDTSDKMDNARVFTANCNATNQINLKPPYDGGSTMAINLRNGFKHEHNEVYITIDKGQFMPSMDGDASIRVKFDDQAPVSYNYNEASSDAEGIIFLTGATSFINKIKKAKHVVIEAEFFDNGYEQVDFDVSGVKWDHL